MLSTFHDKEWYESTPHLFEVNNNQFRNTGIILFIHPPLPGVGRLCYWEGERTEQGRGQGQVLVEHSSVLIAPSAQPQNSMRGQQLRSAEVERGERSTKQHNPLPMELSRSKSPSPSLQHVG